MNKNIRVLDDGKYKPRKPEV